MSWPARLASNSASDPSAGHADASHCLSPNPGRPSGWPGKDGRYCAAALAALSLALYLLTLAPTVATVFDDSLEFQVVLPSLGIAHPTGYPLYTILGWLFSHLPVGDPAYRVNLFSAVAGAATVGLLCLVARRLGVTRAAAAAVSLVYALSPVWWSQATIAEVYTLHGLFMALILLLALDERRTQRPWLALAFGLALTHHRMTLLLAPGLAVYLLWSDPGLPRRPRQMMSLLVALLAPLLLYLYLPLRGLSVSSLDGSYANTWSGFWRHVLASDYGAFLRDNPLAVQRSAAYPLQLLIGQVGWVGLLLGLLGWLRWRERPRHWTLLTLVFLTNMIFAAGYRTADVDVFYLPAIMVWVLWAAAGLSWLLERVAGWRPRVGIWPTLPRADVGWPLIGQGILIAALLVQPLWGAVRTLHRQPQPATCAEVLAVGRPPALQPNRAGEWSVANCGRAILSLPLPKHAAIVGLLGETTLLRYFQIAEHLRPDLTLVAADDEADRLAAVERELAAGRAVYLTRELSGLAARYSLAAEGPLIHVLPPEGMVSPAGLQPVGQTLGAGVRLVGYDLASVPARGAVWLRLRLAWQAGKPVSEELKVSARLLDAGGKVVAAVDTVPVHWAYPTTTWRPGEIILDAYDFALPAQFATQDLVPLVILYHAADGSEIGRFQPSR